MRTNTAATKPAGADRSALPPLGEHTAQVADQIGHRTVLVCPSGVRATTAQRSLAAIGMGDLHVLEEGIPAFDRASGPLVRGRARAAGERPVRLVAGTLVAAGVQDSLWKRPAIILAGAIAAGLTVSPLTDTCAMGRVLSRCPQPGRQAGRARPDPSTLSPEAGS